MGPLSGIKVLEVGGIGPAPFCGMMLADMGAEVRLVERKSQSAGELPGGEAGKFAIAHRGKKSLAIDLKKGGAAAALLRLVRDSDVLIEGFRPGVMEKLGLGPEPCLAANPRLVYGRVTGWGQDGPLSASAGHDINYTGVAGALWHGGHSHAPPAAPPTLVGDIGGGALMLTAGVLAALLHARETGDGQVVDAAISDGAALMTALLWGLRGQGLWQDVRQANLLDGGSHWYDAYECADGRYLSVGALEPRFYRELLQGCGLDRDTRFDAQFDAAKWPAQKKRLAELFRTRSRDDWCEALEGTDACVAPVLDMSEAPGHRHNRARNTFVEVEGVTQPAPAPRFSRTASAVPKTPPGRGEHTRAVLSSAGLSDQEISQLASQGAI